MKTATKRFIIFFLLVVGGCCLAGVELFYFIPNQPKPAATEISAASPTDTPIQPTATSIPPTPTPLSPASTPTPTPTSVPSTPTPAPIFASDNGDGYSSGGLGLSRSDWEQNHTATNLDYNPLGTGYDHTYDVMFQVGNVWYIERQWPAGDAATVDIIDNETQNLIPADSQFIKTYSPDGRPETTVNLYFSESLKSRFDSADNEFGNWWAGGEPGNFIVQYNKYDFGITRMIFSIGNNP
ncbi:MAG: hypothetical protein FOGNACKC_02208 [Anaerolineae bacterium]|nr:hypothetical protein [Anaerolineae bacterium]